MSMESPYKKCVCVYPYRVETFLSGAACQLFRIYCLKIAGGTEPRINRQTGIHLIGETKQWQHVKKFL